MASLNRVTLIGNLGADPEVKSFQNGGKVCNMRVACSESWKDKNGEKQERTEWVTVAVFAEGLAGVCERFLKKGSKVYLAGQLRTRKWQDQSGADRYSTEVVLQGPHAELIMLDGARQGDAQSRSNGSETRNNAGHSGAAQSQSSGSFQDDLDDEIPF